MRYLAGEVRRLVQDEGKMAFISGPRQVGKTTLVRHLLHEVDSDGAYFNWDVESQRRAILRDPESFWASAPPPKSGRLRIGLDEIHKYPRWKRFLKGLFDANAGAVEIVVTGSGRLDVYQKGGDSLFGRYGLCRLHPFTVGEMLSAERSPPPSPDEFWQNVSEVAPPAADEALAAIERFTGFPEPLFAGSDTRLVRWRKAHRDLVLREDLRDLTRIREIGLIDAMVALLPERVGSPLSLNALREDLGVAFGTVQTWLATLDRLYYLFELRPYAGKLARALRREGKVYLFDFTTIDDPARRFENLVAIHLRKLCDAWTDWGYGDFRLSYVRDKEGHEVDFLIADGARPHALVEAKLTETSIDPSLVYYRDRLRPLHAVQVVRQGVRSRTGGANNVMCLPASWFLART